MPNEPTIAQDYNIPTAERGVYFLPRVGPRGERYAVAINRRGEWIAEAVLYPSLADHDFALDHLWAILNHEDPPQPQLLLLA